MLRSIIAPVLTYKNVFVCCFCLLFLFACFWKFLFFLQGERDSKTKKDQFSTYKKANIGPFFNSTAYIYMLWRNYLVQVCPFQGLLSGPSRGYYLVQVCFLAYFYSGFKRFSNTQLSFCFFCPIILQFSRNGLFEKGCNSFQISLF